MVYVCLAFCACFMCVLPLLHVSCTFTLFVCAVFVCFAPLFFFAFFGTIIPEHDDGHDYGDDSEEGVGEDDDGNGDIESCFCQVPQHFSIATGSSSMSWNVPVESEVCGEFVAPRAKD